MNVTSNKMQEQSLFNISWPLFIELALHMGMGVIATLMLSHYSDNAASGVGVANQLLGIFILVFNVTSIAAMILIGQRLGANQLSQARQFARSAVGLNVWFGVIVAILVLVFGEPLLRLFDIQGEVLNYGLIFIRICGASLFLESLSLALSAVLRSHGFTKESMIVSIMMNVISVIGYAMSIFGLFGLPITGVVGVSWTIVIARAFAVVVLLYIVYRRIALTFKVQDIIKVNKQDVREMLYIGIPSAGENLSYQFSQLVITAIVASLGDASLAARVYITNISMLCYLFTVAIAEGTQLLVARYIGGKQYDRALKRGIKTLRIAMVASLTAAVAMAMIGSPILELFTDDYQIIAIGLPILWAVVFTEPGRAMNIVLMSSLKSAGDVRFPVIIGMVSMWGIAVTLSYTLGITFGLGLLGVWLAQGMDEWFRGIFACKRWLSRPWERVRVKNTAKGHI
ncbi:MULTISPECIES: MATE family efflux transporter [Bacillaceae]|uniref:MATE family efflux transporter n=1 Tax=Bacillaceae TaxID=186817 RepID=UPI001E452DED|nr:MULTISPECIES: MATE family efflux transporter [Bacillaceae]MCE4049816.1 MATE family efflux transporter [Bacillus sp. Au-Bac7]MDL0435386.1 MATE family efflux transporter [Niallia sp. SS-2023]UPO87578.1 MATE family efflux transporter [Niallia sp. Man26]